MTVRTTFNKHTNRYDEIREQLIPCFDEFYGTALSLLPFKREQRIDILDLGAGTGLLSDRILQHYPNAHIILLDISENMLLKRAQARFAGVGTQVEFKLSDFSSEPL
jgi:tRNA (cmo5U34)-methyltransferase